MTCHFIPDGKTKAMSTVGHAIDAKEFQKGKEGDGKDAGKAKKQKAPEPKLDDNGEVKLSKKELAKLAKKEKKADLKSDLKAGDGPKKSSEEKVVKAKQAPTPVAVLKKKHNFGFGATFDVLESKASASLWMNGPSASQDDVDALQLVGTLAISPLMHPHLFSWHANASRFAPQVRAGWPLGGGLPDKCYQ